MPRSSPFTIRLSAAESAELRRRSARYTLPYFQVQRANIILMAAEGLENSEIAVRLNTRREVVSEWRKRYAVGNSVSTHVAHIARIRSMAPGLRL